MGSGTDWITISVAIVATAAGVAAAVGSLIAAVGGWRVAKATKQLATDTKLMAQATQASVAEIRAQRLDQSRPYIALRRLRAPTPDRQDPVLARVPYADQFTVLLVNVGGGPALDIAGRIDGSPLRYARRYWNTWDDADPLALSTREDVEMTFKLDGSHIAWQSLYDPLARGESPGAIVVSYGDVHGDQWESRVPLVRLRADPNDRTITLKLGTLAVERVAALTVGAGQTNA